MDEVERVAQYAEQALTNDRYWFDLGWRTGFEDGIDYTHAELEAYWIERRRIENLVPTGETGPDGLPIYVLRLRETA